MLLSRDFLMTNQTALGVEDFFLDLMKDTASSALTI